MSVTDGTVIGRTKILDNGSPARRWNLVLMGDGYRASELTQYATDAQAFVDALLATPPFSDSVFFGMNLHNAINVYRVDVSSTDSGADDPVACGGSGASPATYFDASFCNSGIRRLLVVNDTTALNVAAAQVPEYHMAMVIVNSAIYGGSGGSVATYSMAPSAIEIGLHEMGHTAFGLADEYEYWAGCGVDTNRNNHPASEPSEENVTINTNRATLKWRALVAATTALPTTNNANCSQCDPQGSPVPVGTVGAFEGAHYFHCDAFRPEFNCKMRALGFPFCAVCSRRIRQTLSPHLPSIRIPLLVDLFERFRIKDWVSDPVPLDLIRTLEVIRREQPAESRILTDELSLLLHHLDRLETGELRTLQVRVKSNIARLEAAADLIEAQLKQSRA